MTVADTSQAHRHALYEDGLALVLGTVVVSLSLALSTKAQLMTGSLAGLSLLLHYATNLPFWIAFSVLNLPFYVLAFRRMGWLFTARTALAVSLVSVLTGLTQHWIAISAIAPLYAAISAGTLGGVGLLMLFRHRTGLGGVNILAIYLQERLGIRAGWFLLAVDVLVLSGGLAILQPVNVALSVLSAIVTNSIVALNHKPGRYLGVS
jgi:uncharacterized membrane-anchored protein YitT (DUF2179 family)